jgi:hypothetical protein
LRAKKDVVRLNLNTSRSELITALGLQPDSNNGWTRVKANAVRLGRQTPLFFRKKRAARAIRSGLDDLFFLVAGYMSIYLIPSQIIAGRVAILLRTYSQYIAGNAAGLMASRPNAA